METDDPMLEDQNKTERLQKQDDSPFNTSYVQVKRPVATLNQKHDESETMVSRYGQNDTSAFCVESNDQTASKLQQHRHCLCASKLAHGAYQASSKNRGRGQRATSSPMKTKKAGGISQLMVCNHTAMIKQSPSPFPQKNVMPQLKVNLGQLNPRRKLQAPATKKKLGGKAGAQKHASAAVKPIADVLNSLPDQMEIVGIMEPSLDQALSQERVERPSSSYVQYGDNRSGSEDTLGRRVGGKQYGKSRHVGMELYAAQKSTLHSKPSSAQSSAKNQLQRNKAMLLESLSSVIESSKNRRDENDAGSSIFEAQPMYSNSFNQNDDMIKRLNDDGTHGKAPTTNQLSKNQKCRLSNVISVPRPRAGRKHLKYSNVKNRDLQPVSSDRSPLPLDSPDRNNSQLKADVSEPQVEKSEVVGDEIAGERTMSDAAVGIDDEDFDNNLNDDGIYDQPNQDHACDNDNTVCTHDPTLENCQEHRRPRVIPSAMRGFIKNHADKIYELAHEEQMKHKYMRLKSVNKRFSNVVGSSDNECEQCVKQNCSPSNRPYQETTYYYQRIDEQEQNGFYKPLILHKSDDGNTSLRQTCFYNPRQSNQGVMKVVSGNSSEGGVRTDLVTKPSFSNNKSHGTCGQAIRPWQIKKTIDPMDANHSMLVTRLIPTPGQITSDRISILRSYHGIGNNNSRSQSPMTKHSHQLHGLHQSPHAGKYHSANINNAKHYQNIKVTTEVFLSKVKMLSPDSKNSKSHPQISAFPGGGHASSKSSVGLHQHTVYKTKREAGSHGDGKAETEKNVSPNVGASQISSSKIRDSGHFNNSVDLDCEPVRSRSIVPAYEQSRVQSKFKSQKQKHIYDGVYGIRTVNEQLKSDIINISVKSAQDLANSISTANLNHKDTKERPIRPNTSTKPQNAENSSKHYTAANQQQSRPTTGGGVRRQQMYQAAASLVEENSSAPAPQAEEPLMQRSSSDITNTMLPMNALQLNERVKTKMLMPSQNLQHLDEHQSYPPDAVSKIRPQATSTLDQVSSIDHSQPPRFLKQNSDAILTLSQSRQQNMMPKTSNKSDEEEKLKYGQVNIRSGSLSASSDLNKKVSQKDNNPGIKSPDQRSESVDISSTAVKKNTSLLNMLRMQSVGDNEDLTPAYVKPGKLHDKLTAFDEGMQKQGLVVPAQLEPHVLKGSKQQTVSGGMRITDTPISTTQQSNKVAGAATIVRITTSKVRKRPNTTARINKRLESKQTIGDIRRNPNFRVHKNKTGMHGDSDSAEGGGVGYCRDMATDEQDDRSQVRSRGKTRVTDYLNESIGRSSKGRQILLKANVYRPNLVSQQRRKEQHGLNPLDDYLVGHKLTQRSRPQTQILHRKQSTSSAQTGNKQVYADNHSTSKHSNSNIDTNQAASEERNGTHNVTQSHHIKGKTPQPDIYTQTTLDSRQGNRSPITKSYRANAKFVLDPQAQGRIQNNEADNNAYGQHQHEMPDRQSLRSRSNTSSFLNRHQRLKLQQKNLMIEQEARRTNYLTHKTVKEQLMDEEDLKVKKLMKKEAVRRDIKFACKKSTSHIRAKLQHKIEQGHGNQNWCQRGQSQRLERTFAAEKNDVVPIIIDMANEKTVTEPDMQSITEKHLPSQIGKISQRGVTKVGNAVIIAGKNDQLIKTEEQSLIRTNTFEMQRKGDELHDSIFEPLGLQPQNTFTLADQLPKNFRTERGIVSKSKVVDENVYLNCRAEMQLTSQQISERNVETIDELKSLKSVVHSKTGSEQQKQCGAQIAVINLNEIHIKTEQVQTRKNQFASAEVNIQEPVLLNPAVGYSPAILNKELHQRGDSCYARSSMSVASDLKCSIMIHQLESRRLIESGLTSAFNSHHTTIKVDGGEPNTKKTKLESMSSNLSGVVTTNSQRYGQYRGYCKVSKREPFRNGLYAHEPPGISPQARASTKNAHIAKRSSLELRRSFHVID